MSKETLLCWEREKVFSNSVGQEIEAKFSGGHPLSYLFPSPFSSLSSKAERTLRNIYYVVQEFVSLRERKIKRVRSLRNLEGKQCS